MLRLLAAAGGVLAVAAAVATASVVPVAAATTANTILIDSVSSPPTEPGLLSIQLEAPSPITSLTVHIYSGATLEKTIQGNEFIPPSNLQDGIWTVQSPITSQQLNLGTYQVTVDATDSSGEVTGLSAPEPFFFRLYPTVTIAASATKLSYSEQSVTVTGQVTAYSPFGALEIVAGQQVSIIGQHGDSWSATTDGSGDYSVNVTPDLAGGTSLASSLHTSVSGSPTIAQASSPDIQLTGDVDPVQVNVALSKSTANFGSRVTLSGTAQYEAGGVWLRFANSTIDVTGKDYYSGRSVPAITATTDANGKFQALLPARPTTTWTANPPSSPYLTSSGSQLGLPNSATLTVVLPTRTTRLHVAYNPAGKVTASGCLGLGSAVNSFPDLSSPAGTGLYLQYSRSAHGPWRTLGPLAGRSVPSCHGGTGFSGTVRALALSGHYRVDFTGQLLYQRSVSATEYAATVPTRFSSFSITPRAVSGHGRIRVSGQLQQKARRWKSFGGVTIKIFVEPAGGTTWYWYKKVHVPSSGKFRASFADPVSGHWAVGYAGNSSHLASFSRVVYVPASGTAASLGHALSTHSLSGPAGRAVLAGG